MSEPITIDILRQELARSFSASEGRLRQEFMAMGDRIERKVDAVDKKVDRVEHTITSRFDHFESHFDDTMTAIQTSLYELHDQVSNERHDEYNALQGALLVLAEKTGHFDEVLARLHPYAV